MKRLHNKRRNSGLLSEFLIRHISSCLINNNKEEAKKAVGISKKYFSKGKLLRSELNLFKTLLDTKVRSRHSAQRVLGEVVSLASKMNVRNLDIEKSKLIKEINHTFGNNVYDYMIPNYTVYASIHTLLNEQRNKKKGLDSISKIKLEDSIVEHLIKENTDEVVDILKKNPKYNNAVYKFVVERFHKKYDNKLSENQKKILTKYSVYLISENNGVLKSAIQKEVSIVKEKLRNIKDENVLKDSGLVKKINECYKKLVTTNFDNISEQNVLNLLQYMQLAEEMEF